MLRYLLIAAVFGLMISACSSPVIPTRTPLPTKAPDPVRVLDVSARLNTKGDAYWNYSYLLSVQNTSSQPQGFGYRVKFIDADGYEIAQDTHAWETIGARATETFTAEYPVRSHLAPALKDVQAEIVLRR